MSTPNNKPQHLELPPPNVPPRPGVRNLDEFLSLSPEQQAGALHVWQGFWLKPTPAVDVPNSGTRIILPDPPAQIEIEGWKQPPNAEERESIKNDDWKRF